MQPTTTGELSPRKQAKKDQIRAGAQELFLERGFAATSTDDIARQSSVSKQTLYVYYPKKEALLVDVLRNLIGEGLENQTLRESQVSQASPKTRDELRERLLELANGILASIMQPDYLSLMRVIISETPRLPQLGELFREAVAQRALKSVRDVLSEARNENLIEDADLEHVDAASRMLVGSLLTHAILDGLLVTEKPPQLPPPRRIEAIVDLYMKAIR